MALTEAQAAAERDKHESWLAQQEGVTGTGIGLDSGGQPCIKVYTNRMPAATKNSILARLKGIPVDFEETGEFRAL
jgi:hypothetical protein